VRAKPQGAEGAGGFPATRWSAIVAARSEDPAERGRALDALLAAYWRPVYKYIRIGKGKPREDAEDLTQEFFLRLVGKNLLDAFQPERGRLRTYLRACVDHLVANLERGERRKKRGGDAVHLSLDFPSAEGELRHVNLSQPPEMEAFFEREWARSVLQTGVRRLRAELSASGKSIYFQVFARYDLEDTEQAGPSERRSYHELARELNLKPTDVTNYLAHARREFRRIVLEFLRRTAGSDEEFRQEARTLLGIGHVLPPDRKK